MGRISMPQLPPLNPTFREKSKTINELSKAIQTLTSFFLNSPNCLVITGAGLSVDSGIRAYRFDNFFKKFEWIRSRLVGF